MGKMAQVTEALTSGELVKVPVSGARIGHVARPGDPLTVCGRTVAGYGVEVKGGLCAGCMVRWVTDYNGVRTGATP